MAKDSVIRDIASAPTLTKEQRAVQEKLAAYRDKALTGDDGVFDSAHGVFLFHGKHKGLVGVEAVIAIDLASMIATVAQVMQTTVVPILMGHVTVQQAKRD